MSIGNLKLVVFGTIRAATNNEQTRAGSAILGEPIRYVETRDTFELLNFCAEEDRNPCVGFEPSCATKAQNV
jgi:hypothetical protein